jgi:hypothetical protein
MVKKITPEAFLKTLEISMLFLTGLSVLVCFLIFHKLYYTISLLFGAFIGYLNFRSTKNDGIKTLLKVRTGLAPQKGVVLYMSKFYLRLFATGVLLFFSVKFLHLNILFILAGISIIYLQIVLMALTNFYLKKIEIA